MTNITLKITTEIDDNNYYNIGIEVIMNFEFRSRLIILQFLNTIILTFGRIIVLIY